MTKTKSACPGNSAFCRSRPRRRAGEVLLRILPKKRLRYLAARLFEKALLLEKAQILCYKKAPLFEKKRFLDLLIEAGALAKRNFDYIIK